MSADLDAIRHRHQVATDAIRQGQLPTDVANAWAAGHDDRGALLDIVDRLAKENARLADERDGAIVIARLQSDKVDRSRWDLDRLTAELAESRAAYDAVCRSVGASLRRPMQHGADPDPLNFDGGAA